MMRYFHRNYLWLGGIVGSVLTGLQIAGWQLYCLLMVLAAGVFVWQKQWRNLTIGLLAVLLGVGAVWFCRHGETVHDSYLENVKVRIDDSNALGAAWNDDEQGSRRLSGVLLNKTPHERLQLYLPKRLKVDDLEFGRSYQVSGNFYVPALPAQFYWLKPDGSHCDITERMAGNSYRKYLRTENIRGTLVVERIIPVTKSPNQLMQWRRRALQRLDANLTDADHRAVLGAITLGFRNRISRELKDAFSQVGVAHVFSISGLHVGILAALAMIILRPLPLLLHTLAVSTLVFYVIATGGAAPAVRAFAMVLVLEIFKAQLLKIRPLEVLSLIAAALILYNPHYVCDVGFQYSFIVTGVLIMSSDAVREVMRSASGVRSWWGVNNKLTKWLLKLRGQLAGTVFLTLIACVASWSLTMYHQNSFFAGAVLVNLLLLPVLTPLFMVAILKYILPGLSSFWNLFLEIMLDYLLWIVKSFAPLADNPGVIAPHWLLTAALLVLLSICLCCRLHRAGVIAVLFLGGAVLLWSCTSGIHPQRVMAVITGGNIQNPVAAVILPQAHTMYLLNSNRDAVYALKDVCTYYGIKSVEQLDIGRPVADCVSGIKTLQRYYPVKKIRKSSLPVRSPQYRKSVENIILQNGAENNILRYPGGQLQLIPQTSGSWLVRSNSQEYELKRTSRVRVHLFK